MLFTNYLIDKLNLAVMKAQGTIYFVKTRARRLHEEDEGLDVVITVVLLAIGLVVAGVLAKYASQIIDAAGKQVDKITNTSTTNGSGTEGLFAGGGGGGGGGSVF